jgi:hypothetical protein
MVAGLGLASAKQPICATIADRLSSCGVSSLHFKLPYFAVKQLHLCFPILELTHAQIPVISRNITLVTDVW